MENISAIILSGGLNTRMGGKNKSFLPIGKETFLERIISVLKNTCKDIIIATKCPEEYCNLNQEIKVVKDSFNKNTPLSGIHAGLCNCSCEYAFVVGCDMPFIKREVVEVLKEKIEKDFLIIVPKQGIYYQPLCAIYSKGCISHIEELIKLEVFKIDKLFKRVKIKEVDEKEFIKVDPYLKSFININTEEDYKKALLHEEK